LNEPKLLTDEQMRLFITQGFLMLQTDFSDAFHQKLLEQLHEVYEKEGNPGNNILPRIRELQKVFDHPTVTGALTSVLGPDYLMHQHRHGHYNAENAPGRWHKDSYWGYRRTMRNHHPWWAMIMYFPQDTPIELGPTGVMPGTHNYDTRVFPEEEYEYEATAQGKAGTFALIHYDMWHRSTPNTLGTPRYMLKFEFMRTAPPTAPTWENLDATWQKPATCNTPFAEHPVMWEDTWRWLRGELCGLADTKLGSTAQERAALQEQLASTYEPDALNASYALSTMGREGIDILLNALHHENVKVSRIAAYGCAVAGSEAVAGLTEALRSERAETVAHAAFALGELRHLASGAAAALHDLMAHESPKVRFTVCEALSMIAQPADICVDGLIRGLEDADVQVRFTAAQSLTRLGAAADRAIPYLETMLDDENRYVRGHALDALRYIGTERARDVLINQLFQTRWCSSTTPASTFYP
jgi:HEAT repeat protein